MVAIVAIRHQALAVLHGQQPETSAVIPAARPLAQVAAGRPHVADLRARDAHHGTMQRRIFSAHGGVPSEFIESNRRADSQSLGRMVNAAQLLNAFDIHHAFGSVDEILHQADLIRTAGENIRFTPLGSQQSQRVMQSGRACIFEGLHYAVLLSRAASTRAGVSGTLGALTPMAFATALAIAAIPPMAHGSPNPTTPRLSISSRISIRSEEHT